jgi:mRNA-degrading endonuclease toxin of MazEF toxin-antitoxin module
MPAACVVNADDIMTVPKDLLRERLTVLSAGKVKALAEAIRFALDL